MTFQTSFRPCVIVFFTIATFVTLKAQAPQVINYQAVVRDAAGEIVKNKAVNFRLSILDSGPSGTPQYVETQNKTTNQFGLVTFGIGQGTTVSGSMNAVTWATGNKFFKVELDINAGNNFSVMSTSQFLSVPYALYAANGGNAAGWGLSGNAATSTDKLGTTNAQDLRIVTNGTQKAVLTTEGKLGIGTNFPNNYISVVADASGLGEVDNRVLMSLQNTSTSFASNAALKVTAGNSGSFTILNHHSSTYTVTNDADDMGQIWSSGKGLIIRASPLSASQDYNGSIRFYTGWQQAAFASNERMRIEANGNIGIGTAAPKAKVEVANGDVYLTDPTKGIILKSPNGNCWRVTVDNTGNLVRTQITCPQ